ncbi:Os06g0609775, partial [Oryza sativa Japonica Group]
MTKFTNCSIIAPPEAPRRRRSRVGCSRRSCTRRSHKAPTSSYPPQLPPPTSLTQPNPNPRPNQLNPPTKFPPNTLRSAPAASRRRNRQLLSREPRRAPPDPARFRATRSSECSPRAGGFRRGRGPRR